MSQTKLLQIEKQKKHIQINLLKVVLPTKKLESTNNRQFATVKMNKSMGRFQLDTGNDITIIDEKRWNRIGNPNMEKNDNLPVEYWARNYFSWENYV